MTVKMFPNFQYHCMIAPSRSCMFAQEFNFHAAELCFQWIFMMSNVIKVWILSSPPLRMRCIPKPLQVKPERWSTEGTTLTEVNLWSTPAVGSSLKAILWGPQVCGTAENAPFMLPLLLKTIPPAATRWQRLTVMTDESEQDVALQRHCALNCWQDSRPLSTQNQHFHRF